MSLPDTCKECGWHLVTCADCLLCTECCACRVTPSCPCVSCRLDGTRAAVRNGLAVAIESDSIPLLIAIPQAGRGRHTPNTPTQDGAK